MLISALYDKTLRLGAEELKKAAAITLLNTDLRAVETLTNICYETCASVVEVALGLVMLAKFVASATVFALIPTISTLHTISIMNRPNSTTFSHGFDCLFHDKVDG